MLLATPALAQSAYDSDANAGLQSPTCAASPDHPLCAPDSSTTPFSLAAGLPEVPEATGTITKIDVASSAVMLDDGRIFLVPAEVAVADLSIGQKVRIAVGQQARITFDD